jgi:hypothetical protein
MIERWIVTSDRAGFGFDAEDWVVQDIDRDAVLMILSREILRFRQSTRSIQSAANPP